MSKRNTTNQVKVLQMIRDDMERDAHEYNHATFDGRTVAEMFGKSMAAISAVAAVLQEHLEEESVDG